MKTKTRILSPEVLVALLSIEWAGNHAMLTCGQLSPKVYKAVNDALESLGGKWSKKHKAHIFDDAAHDELEAVIETGSYESGADIKQVMGEFFTPDGLADEIVRLANINEECDVLEPSAGDGQLIRALDRRFPVIPEEGSLVSCTAVEIQERHREALCDLAVSFDIADFLSLTPESKCDGLNWPYGLYDRVVMNPPFARQADIDHVMHAWSFLKPGGRLVAIMSSGWTFRTNQKSRDFQAFIEQHNGEWWANENDAFKDAGANVKTVTIVLDKPSA